MLRVWRVVKWRGGGGRLAERGRAADRAGAGRQGVAGQSCAQARSHLRCGRGTATGGRGTARYGAVRLSDTAKRGRRAAEHVGVGRGARAFGIRCAGPWARGLGRGGGEAARYARWVAVHGARCTAGGGRRWVVGGGQQWVAGSGCACRARGRRGGFAVLVGAPRRRPRARFRACRGPGVGLLVSRGCGGPGRVRAPRRSERNRWSGVEGTVGQGRKARRARGGGRGGSGAAGGGGRGGSGAERAAGQGRVASRSWTS